MQTIKPLYRYLEKQHVEEFFSTGALLLTSYNRCRDHEDQARRDSHEGKYGFEFRGEANSLAVSQTAGDRSYMLCTSLSSERYLMDSFRIDQPNEFLSEVAKVLPNFVESRLGPCRYVWNRSAIRSMPDHEFMPDAQRILAAARGELDANLDEVWHQVKSEFAQKISKNTSDIGYFAKTLKYVSQAEFRMIWTVSEKTEEWIIVHCPKAIQYCTRNGLLLPKSSI
jgi:hypothetical protein